MAGVSADQQALYVKDMYKAEREGYRELPTTYDKVYTVVNGVTGAGDKSTGILGPGRFKRHTQENESVDFKSPIQGWDKYVRYWLFSDGVAFSKEAVDDTVKLGNLLKDYAREWGRVIRIEKEEFAARPFNKGGDLTPGDYVFNGTHVGNTDGSGGLLYDSKPLFNLTGNARTTKGGGTYYTSVASLTVSPEDFETLYILQTVTNAKNERDQEIENPCDTLLVRSGADRFAAEKIVDTSKGMPGGELNDINPYYKIVSVMDWRYINATAGYFVGRRKHPDVQFHDRQVPEIRFFRDESNLGFRASCNVRFAPWWKTFHAWVRGGGTSTTGGG